jgi:hypothetical protein
MFVALVWLGSNANVNWEMGRSKLIRLFIDFIYGVVDSKSRVQYLTMNRKIKSYRLVTTLGGHGGSE